MADNLRIVLSLDGDGKVTAGLLGVRSGLTETQSSVITLNQGLELLAKGYNVIAAATRRAVGFIGEAISASNQQENEIKALNQTLVTTGQFTADYSAKLQALAGVFQETTTFGDEAVLGVERQLVAFGAAPDIITRATAAVLDFSAATGRDLRTATELVGKAIAGNFGTLSRYGIFVDENATKTKKLEQALAQIEQRFGGQAAAAAETFAGKLLSINNLWGDFLEKIGDAIKRSDFVADALGAVRDVLVGLNGGMSDADGLTRNFNDALRSTILLLAEGAGTALTFARNISLVVETLPAIIRDMAGLTQTSGQLEFPITIQIEEAAKAMAALQARLETFGTDAPRQITPAGESLDRLEQSAREARDRVGEVGDAIEKLPNEKNIDINVRENRAGGGGLPITALGSGVSTNLIDFKSPIPFEQAQALVAQGASTNLLARDLTVKGPTFEPQVRVNPLFKWNEFFREGGAGQSMVEKFVARASGSAIEVGTKFIDLGGGTKFATRPGGISGFTPESVLAGVSPISGFTAGDRLRGVSAISGFTASMAQELADLLVQSRRSFPGPGSGGGAQDPTLTSELAALRREVAELRREARRSADATEESARSTGRLADRFRTAGFIGTLDRISQRSTGRRLIG